jgi:septal ring factor EnvC (AmiA/AmiB activator)
MEAILEMVDRATRKKLKKIQKEINRLKKELMKLELRPCHGDADLNKKDEDVRMLRREIYQLEKEANRYVLYVSGITTGL